MKQNVTETGGSQPKFKGIVAKEDDHLAAAILEIFAKGAQGRTTFEFADWKTRECGLVAEGTICGQRVVLIKLKEGLESIGELGFDPLQVIAVVGCSALKDRRQYSIGRQIAEQRSSGLPSWAKETGEVVAVFQEAAVRRVTFALAVAFFKERTKTLGYPPPTSRFGGSGWTKERLSTLAQQLVMKEGCLVHPGVEIVEATSTLPDIIKEGVGKLFETFLPEVVHGGVVEAVWQTITSPMICKSRVGHLSDKNQKVYKKQIEFWVKQEKPIEIVFIGFPFKVINPLRTNGPYPDFGELTFLRRLLAIGKTVEQVYPPGIRWVIITEGEEYSTLFPRVTPDWVKPYQETIAEWVEMLPEGKERIQLDSLARLAKFNPKLRDVAKEITEELLRQYYHWGTIPGNSFFEHVHELFFVLPSEELSLLELLHIYYASDKELSEAELKLKAKLIESAARSACDYLAFNEAKNRVGAKGIIQDAHSHALYVSITSKRGRFAFHPIHREALYFPHHGVAVETIAGHLEIRYHFEILAHPESYISVMVPGTKGGAPFYYKER